METQKTAGALVVSPTSVWDVGNITALGAVGCSEPGTCSSLRIACFLGCSSRKEIQPDTGA